MTSIYDRAVFGNALDVVVIVGPLAPRHQISDRGAQLATELIESKIGQDCDRGRSLRELDPDQRPPIFMRVAIEQDALRSTLVWMRRLAGHAVRLPTSTTSDGSKRRFSTAPLSR